MLDDRDIRVEYFSTGKGPAGPVKATHYPTGTVFEFTMAPGESVQRRVIEELERRIADARSPHP